ncbi:MAG: hypothetical protein ABJA82_00555 [Myxococcales bacterium]
MKRTASILLAALLASLPACHSQGPLPPSSYQGIDRTGPHRFGALYNPAVYQSIRGLRIGDDSRSDIQQGGSNPAIATTDYTWYRILAGALNVPTERMFNHASAGTQLTQANAGYGWVTVLNGILSTKSQSQIYPAVQYGELLVEGYGINDLSQNIAANTTKIIADLTRCKLEHARAHRAAAWYPAQGSGQWAFGANFSNSTNIDTTIGTAKQASVVDSAGSSTATFTIPSGYKGETITFYLLALSGGSLIITWGGTVSGTTGSTIVGRTDTLSNLTVNAVGCYPVVFTPAATGLAAANAGQTITVRITTVAASTFTLEGATVEAKEPAPIVFMNQARLPELTYTWEFGDGVINGTTTLTSATAAQFNSGTDVGGTLAITDGGTGGLVGATVNSVTNTTTLVMSAAASASRSGVKFSLTRKLKGYSGIGGALNTNFSGATAASHAAADADIAASNTALVNMVAGLGSKAVIADLDAEMGGDLLPPSGQYSWWETGGLHFNEVGQKNQAKIVFNASGTLGQESGVDDGALMLGGGASRTFGTLYWPTRANNVITTPYVGNGTAYPCAVGDVFATWFYISDPTTEAVSFGVEQPTGVAAGSTIRMALYSDVNAVGYPDVIINDLGTLAIGTTTGVKTIANTHVLRAGWYWVAMRVEVLGTPSTLRTVTGPQPFGPFGQAVAAGGLAATAPMGYKAIGATTGSAFPDRFYLANGTPAVNVVNTVPLIYVTVTKRQ